MPDQPAALIQESIDKLEQLWALLTADLRAGAVTASPATLAPEQRLGKEVLLGISVLLPKLRAAHRWRDRNGVWQAAPPVPARRGCPSCED